MLKEHVQNEMKLFRLKTLKDSLFYNCQYGIRFEIGVEEVYKEDMTSQKEYIENALNRVMTIYNEGIKSPGVLLWEVYPQSKKTKSNLQDYFSKNVISVLPQEEFLQYIDIDNDIIKQVQLYWDLKKSNIPMDKLFREIIIGDLGGLMDFTSSIYLFDLENHVILYLYDDRGLDIVAYDKITLSPIYKKLNEWILDYDRKEIDKIFFN